MSEPTPTPPRPGISSSGPSLPGAADPAPAPRQAEWAAPARYVPPRPRRRVFAPAVLFLATCGSTFFVGAVGWDPADAGPGALFANPGRAWELATSHAHQGLVYMFAIIGILSMHEMGHFLQAVRYRVPASWPFFLPMPLMLTGTMGAVIGMQGSRADRKQLFDIGLSGPWAGLLAAAPVIWVGIQTATAAAPDPLSWRLGDPLIFKLLTWYLRPDLPDGHVLMKNPLLMAGWVGMLVTGLNMLPVSQLDGGHVLYSLFGARAHVIARAFVMSAIAAMVIADYYQWVVMLVLVLLMGVDHPPTRDDHVPLGWFRRLIGFASLFIPVFCFTPKIV